MLFSTPSTNKPNTVLLWQPPGLEGTELIHAVDVRHTQPRQAVPEYKFVLIASGARKFYYRGTQRIATVGTLIVLQPGEVHGSQGIDQTSASVQILSVASTRIAEALTEPDSCFTLHTDGLFADRKIADRLRLLHASLAPSHPILDQQCALSEFLSFFFTRFGSRYLIRDSPETGPVARVRSLIEDRYSEDLSLDELAAYARLSPAYLCRAFRSQTGLSPHAFHTSVRIARARTLLVAGQAPSEVAASIGFFDQAHFTHTFRRYFNMSPGRYQQHVRK